PARAMAALTALCRAPSGPQPGGMVVVLDYERHRDEAMREQHADLWLGFEPAEIEALARDAGLSDIHRARIPTTWCGQGPDRHLRWQLLSARRGADKPSRRKR
ncbi:MAG: ArsR family transcriptional regulator, partial [Proteobacteria bacterium]|nr:ArsR family transcriptional regulator [Pseudomonadota bacterium]